MTLDLSDLDGFATVIVTSADVTGRPVGKRVSVDVFGRVVHEGIPLRARRGSFGRRQTADDRGR